MRHPIVLVSDRPSLLVTETQLVNHSGREQSLLTIIENQMRALPALPHHKVQISLKCWYSSQQSAVTVCYIMKTGREIPSQQWTQKGLSATFLFSANVNRWLGVGTNYRTIIPTRSNWWTFDQMTARLCQHSHSTGQNDNEHEWGWIPLYLLHKVTWRLWLATMVGRRERFLDKINSIIIYL